MSARVTVPRAPKAEYADGEEVLLRAKVEYRNDARWFAINYLNDQVCLVPFGHKVIVRSPPPDEASAVKVLRELIVSFRGHEITFCKGTDAELARATVAYRQARVFVKQLESTQDRALIETGDAHSPAPVEPKGRLAAAFNALPARFKGAR